MVTAALQMGPSANEIIAIGRFMGPPGENGKVE
jgi:hypothetical protein